MPNYDGLDRLKTANAPSIWGTASYTYDAADNLLSANVGSRTVTLNFTDGTNRLNSITQGGATIPYSYDPRGNISAKGGQTFGFDLGNRLNSSSLGGAYVYDGHGRRIKVVSSDGSTRLQVYTSDGKLMWSTNVGGGRPTSSTAYVYVGGRLIAEWDSAKGVQYIHTDALGSPVARTNASGGLIGRTRYEPFGLTAAGTRPGPATSIVGFTGHVQDPETDLVYMQQRYYEPIAGRFLSVDPIVTDAATGKSFGRYHYGENNPYKYTDPDGRASCADKDCKTSTLDSTIKRADGGTTKVTFVNDSPKGASPNQPILTATAVTVERVIGSANVDSVNVNSTTGGDHSKTSAHYAARAVDINKVDGQQVGKDNAGTGRVQQAAQSDKNVRENFGPNIMEKRSGANQGPAAVTDQKLTAAHKTHIHLSTQPLP